MIDYFQESEEGEGLLIAQGVVEKTIVDIYKRKKSPQKKSNENSGRCNNMMEKTSCATEVENFVKIRKKCNKEEEKIEWCCRWWCCFDKWCWSRLGFAMWVGYGDDKEDVDDENASKSEKNNKVYNDNENNKIDMDYRGGQWGHFEGSNELKSRW